MADNQTQSTLDWYVAWLADQRPDLSEEQRLVMATDFAGQQAPSVRKPDDDPADDNDGLRSDAIRDAEDSREEQRRRIRLTGKELTAILNMHKDAL